MIMKYGRLIRLSLPSDAKKAFASLKEGGFDCCHLVYKPEHYLPEDAEIIKEAAESEGIGIAALFAGFRDNCTKWNIYSDYIDAGINSPKYGKERVKYLREAAKFAHLAGIENMVIHAGFVPNDPFSRKYIKTVKIMRGLAKYCLDSGINLLLESGGESPVTLLRLISDVGTGNIFSNLDTANLIMYGYGNPCDALYTIGKYVKSVHIKDGLPPTDPLKLGKETNFGEGAVEFDRFFALIREFCQGVPLIIEREIPDGKTEEMLHKTLSIIKKYN